MATKAKVGQAKFGPLPIRAIKDFRLSSLEVRLLAAIGFHDRLSLSRGAGAGCWAGNKKLADECDCRPDSLSAAITALVVRGYVTREPHPINKRLRVYRVIYDLDDRANAKPSDADNRADAQVSDVKSAEKLAPAAIVGQIPNEPQPTIGQRKQEVHESKNGSGVEYITHKRENILLKQKEYSPKGHLPLRVGGWPGPQSRVNHGATLALIERGLEEGSVLDPSTRQAIEAILVETDTATPINQQAVRILKTWGSTNVALPHLSVRHLQI
jgi:DNA-binding MarR family transcriptional regulator